MSLGEYLKPIDEVLRREQQQDWFRKLERTCKKGIELYNSSSESIQGRIRDEFRNRVRTEELKAWYSEPEGDSLFQGTSVSSLTVPCRIPKPLDLDSMEELEEEIAGSYINLHKKNIDKVRGAIVENVDEWIREGLYYGVVLSAKVITQALGLVISQEDAIFDVKGHRVDPHEITSHPSEVREAYFEKCKEKITCFDGLDLEQRELEASLVLADITKPNMEKYNGKIMLAPIRCNEIACVLAERVTARIAEKTLGEIRPRSLTVVIYDTDTPYTYHQVMGYVSHDFSPVLPGLTVLGASGTIDAFRWLYSYRLSLIAQKMQKGSLYSEVHKSFMPFIFFGVLIPRDAEILLDLNNLHRLRYRGNFSPDLEFTYLIPGLYKNEADTPEGLSWDQFRKNHQMIH